MYKPTVNAKGHLVITDPDQVERIVNALHDSIEYRGQQIVDGYRDEQYRRLILDRRDEMRWLYDGLVMAEQDMREEQLLPSVVEWLRMNGPATPEAIAAANRWCKYVVYGAVATAASRGLLRVDPVKWVAEVVTKTAKPRGS